MIYEGKVNWANVFTVNEMSGKYSIDVIELTPKQVKDFEKEGVNVREKEGQGKFVTIKSTGKVPVYDSRRKPWPEDKLIGNGSVCRVAWSTYDWNKNGKSGRSAGLQAVVVMEHVPYESVDKDELFDGLEVEDDVFEEAPFDDDIDDDDEEK